jgi:hypothetical protein
MIAPTRQQAPTKFHSQQIPNNSLVSCLVHIHVIAGASIESVALEPVASHLAAAMAAVGMEAFVAVAVAAESTPDPLMPRRARYCEVPTLVRHYAELTLAALFAVLARELAARQDRRLGGLMMAWPHSPAQHLSRSLIQHGHAGVRHVNCGCGGGCSGSCGFGLGLHENLVLALRPNATRLGPHCIQIHVKIFRAETLHTHKSLGR